MATLERRRCHAHKSTLFQSGFGAANWMGLSQILDLMLSIGIAGTFHKEQMGTDELTGDSWEIFTSVFPSLFLNPPLHLCHRWYLAVAGFCEP